MNPGTDLDRLMARVARHHDRPERTDVEPVDRRLPGGDLRGLLALAAHASTAGIMITDGRLDRPGPTVLYVNPAFEAMTGYSSEQIVGETPRVLQGPATDRAVLERLRNDLLCQGHFAGEAVNYRADGTPFIMSWQVRALPDPAGGPGHYVAIQSDKTAERMHDHEEREAARRLQREMLPEVPDRLGSLELTARYVPVESDLAIGGDWYDAFEIDDSTVALVVGDVAGHGVASAAAMGRLRWSVRSLLSTGISLAEVLRHIRSFTADEDLFATMGIVLLDRERHTVDIVTVGHPPVLLWSPRGVRQVWTANPLLGLPSAVHAERRTRIEPDETLVLYTDGVIDGGRREVSWLSSVLQALDGRPGCSLERIADELLERVAEEGAGDDVAVLLARPCGDRSGAAAIDLTDEPRPPSQVAARRSAAHHRIR
jgi:PAS domain S-box-containing protein